MLKFVDHIDMLVEDLEAEVEFLTKLGFIVKRRLPDHGNAVEMQLPGEDQVVFEMRAAGDKKPCIRHIAFRVADENTVDELKQNGVVFRTENRFVPATGRTVSNVNDPNGNSWQLTDWDMPKLRDSSFAELWRELASTKAKKPVGVQLMTSYRHIDAGKVPWNQDGYPIGVWDSPPADTKGPTGPRGIRLEGQNANLIGPLFPMDRP